MCNQAPTPSRSAHFHQDRLLPVGIVAHVELQLVAVIQRLDRPRRAEIRVTQHARRRVRVSAD